MSKLFNSIAASMPEIVISMEEWNATTMKYFTPYFLNSTHIKNNIESLRLELRNLARILDHSEYLDLLDWTLNLYRNELNKDRQNVLEFLANKIHLSEKSDSTWLSLFQTSQKLPEDKTLYDTVFQIFSTIDGVLEGCYKPHFELLYSFAFKVENGQFPQTNRRLDFGSMKAQFPSSIQAPARLYLSDPRINLGINQWRNIGAHKTFKVISENSIELEYGMQVPPNKIHISLAHLRETLSWIFRIHTSARMASLILYLENMPHIKPLMTHSPNIRFEQQLTRICHDLELVGFRCSNLEKLEKKVSLSLICTLEKDRAEAVIHASQILDQLAMAIEFDQLMNERYEFVEINVHSVNGSPLGRAKVNWSHAIEFTKGEHSLEGYASLVEFDFDDSFS